MSRVLIFGSNGMTGWELANRAALRGHDVVALSREQADVASERAVIAAVAEASPDVIINAAAYTAVDQAERQRDTAMHVNANGAGHIARAAAQRGIALVHISTDYVFDGKSDTPYLPEDRVRPLGVYGESKLAGEEAVRVEASRHAIVRTSWIFSHRGRNFVRTMIDRGKTADRLRVVNDQCGRPTSAADLADALLVVADMMLRNEALSGTWHFANSGTTTWYDLAREIFAMRGGGPPIDAIATADFPTLARRPEYSALDTSSFEATFGITPRPWRDALRDTLEQIN